MCAPRNSLIISLLTALIISLIPDYTYARTWNINDTGTGDAPSIQAGIDSAGTGDVVSLADGTYTGTGNRNVNFNGKEITVRSASGNRSDCIVDVGGSASTPYFGFLMLSGETTSSVLEGLTVRGAYNFSGGVLIDNASPTIINCVFTGNTATIGGGAMSIGMGAPLITECKFEENTAVVGGAVYCNNASPTFQFCEFKNDSASGSGGAFASEHGSPTLEDCRFLDNWAVNGGGAIACFYDDDATLTDLFLSGNEAGQFGGGMSLEDNVVSTVSGCTLTVNTAQVGGALHIAGNSTISHCTIYDNTATQSAGAIVYAGGLLDVTSCTISGNSAVVGGGLACTDDQPVTVTNTIIANSAQGEAVYCFGGAVVSLDCCDVFGNAGGDWVGCLAQQDTLAGNFSADPAFCGVPGSGNFGLQSDSPCAPGNHPKGTSCGLIGALAVDCGVSPVRNASWSEIRLLFKKKK